MTAAALIRSVREEAGLSQLELARRMGSSQPVIAGLERTGANPTLRTLERALRAAGRRLEIAAVPLAATVDEDQLARRLRLTPSERLAAFEREYAALQKLRPQSRRDDRPAS
jgi:transcriptional regulator with XRE-family HTH domain